MSTLPSLKSLGARSNPLGFTLDLDQTLVDSRVAKPLRATRQWSEVYNLIPQFKLMPGAEGLLSTALGVRVAIVTNSPSAYAERVLSHFNLRADVVVGFHDTTQRKPHPEPIQLALRQLGLAPKDVWAAGDHAHDIQAAVAAGVAVTIGVTSASDDVAALKRAMPSALVPDLASVLDCVRRLA